MTLKSALRVAFLVLTVSVGACKGPDTHYTDAGNGDDDGLDATADDVPPDTTIVTHPAALAASATATFEFTSSEDGSTFECAVDGAAFAACASGDSFTVADGAHDFAVRAKDAAGNLDDTPATFAWTVDTTPPDTTISAGPPALDNAMDVTFAFDATEAGTFECRR
jgi:hypothetical protein